LIDLGKYYKCPVPFSGVVKKKRVKNLNTKNEVIVHLKAELNAIREEVRNDVVGPVVASFGFIIALIWRDAIQSAIGEFLQRAGLIEREYIYQFVSAVIVTVVVIVIMVVVTKLGRKRKKERIRKSVKERLGIS